MIYTIPIAVELGDEHERNTDGAIKYIMDTLSNWLDILKEQGWMLNYSFEEVMKHESSTIL